MQNTKTMQSSYYKFVNLPSNSFYKDQLLDELANDDLNIKTTPAGRHWRKWGHRTHLLTDELYTLLDSINCEVLEAEVFYTAPFSVLPWHIDMNPPADNTKLNFVWGSDNHKMRFGEIADLAALDTTSTTQAGSQYVEFNPTQVNPKDIVCLNKPALINSGRPHSVINWSNKGRWCLSVIITHNKQRILFDDAVRLFSEYVLD